MSKIIGIDLGTSNSCVAVMYGGEPVIIPNKVGGRVTPSAVSFQDNNEVVVGEAALRSSIIKPKTTVTGIKRFIGRYFNEVIDLVKTVPYDVIPGKNNLAMVNINGVNYSPQLISSLILRYLKESAEDYLGQVIDKAVITVPAYFGDRQREATKEAGMLAGLKIMRVINEPTAAAMAYGLDRKPDESVMIFDLGGGTFDISVLELGEGVAEVKAIAGDGFLGGDDFDARLVDWVVKEFGIEHKIDLSVNAPAMQRIRNEVTLAKCDLSTVDIVNLCIPFIAQQDTTPVSIESPISRVKFEQLCDELFERLIPPIKDALRGAGLRTGHIDKVIMVGGATRMPKVLEIVKTVLNVNPSKSINPEEAVALGAAIQAGVLAGDVKDMLLLDATSKSLGIETWDGMYARLIESNTIIPTRKSELFSTSVDGQTSVEINILEGEGPLATDNRILGRLVLRGLSPLPRGLPQIEVTFDIDANSILDASVKDLGSGIEEKSNIKIATGLSKADLDEARQYFPNIKGS